MTLNITLNFCDPLITTVLVCKVDMKLPAGLGVQQHVTGPSLKHGITLQPD